MNTTLTKQVLQHIADHGPVDVASMADALHEDRAEVQACCERYTNKELIRATNAEKCRRFYDQKLYVLTESGRAVLAGQEVHSPALLAQNVLDAARASVRTSVFDTTKGTK